MFWIQHASPPGEPHPLARLRLLDFGARPVLVTEGLIPRSNLTKAHFADICSILNLATLRLSKLKNVTADWMEPLRNHPTLIDLQLHRMPLPGSVCEAIATIPNLEGVNFNDTTIGDEGVRALAASPTIHAFGLARVGVTDDGLAALANRERISRITLRGNPITDAAFTLLPLENVDGLNLSETRCGDGSLAHLRGRWATPGEGTASVFGFKIELQDSAVTDAGLAHLTEVPKIRDLDLSGTAVTGHGFAAFKEAGRPLPEDIDLNRTAFNDAGCAFLADLYQNAPLRLGCYKSAVTDAGFAHLSKLSGLKSIRMGGPKVTDAGVAALAPPASAQRKTARRSETGGRANFGRRMPAADYITLSTGKSAAASACMAAATSTSLVTLNFTVRASTSGSMSDTPSMAASVLFTAGAQENGQSMVGTLKVTGPS